MVARLSEFFSGYDEDPVALLQRTFEETDGYDEIVVLKDIRFESHCEHHIAPIIGKAHVAYLPDNRVVGISKLARLVEVYRQRLQIQEKMTAQIANTLDEVLQPKGVAVVIEAAHQCMTTRGVHKPGVSMVTSRMLGAFRNDPRRGANSSPMIGTPAAPSSTTCDRLALGRRLSLGRRRAGSGPTLSACAAPASSLPCLDHPGGARQESSAADGSWIQTSTTTGRK